MSEIQHPKIYYDSEDRTLYLNFGEYGREIELACFSGDGTRLLTVKDVGVASIWDVASRTLLQEIRPTSSLAGREEASPFGSKFVVFIEAVALNNDGSLALLGLNDGTAGVFSTHDGTRLSTLYPPNTTPAEKWGVVRGVNFSPDGSLALVGFPRRSVGVWRVHDGTLVQFLSGFHAERLFRQPFVRDTLASTVAASHNNQYVFAGFADMTATLWNMTTQEVVFDAYQHVEKILGFWVRNERICWATSGGSVWEGDARQGVTQRLATGELWQEVAFSPDGQRFLVRTLNGLVKQRSLEGRSECLGQTSVHPSDRAKTVAVGQKRKLTVWGDGDKHLNIITPEHAVRIERNKQITGFVLSPQEDLLATYGGAGSVEVWRIPTGERVHVFHHKSTASAVTFSSDGNFLAVGITGNGGSGAIRPISIWNLQTGTLWCTLEGHIHQIHALAFGPQNKWLVSASLDRTIRMWQLDQETPSNSSEIQQLTYEDLEFHHLAVLSDGRILVFRSNLLEVWHNQQKIIEIPVPHYFQNQWQISEDEASIGGSFNGQIIRQWSLHTGQEIHVYQSDILRPEFVPDVSVNSDKESFRPTAGCYLWRTPGGTFTHIGDGPRGWAIPITLSSDGKTTIIPGVDAAALIDVHETPRILALLPFEGKLRATRVVGEHIFMLNSTGHLFIHKIRPLQE